MSNLALYNISGLFFLSNTTYLVVLTFVLNSIVRFSTYLIIYYLKIYVNYLLNIIGNLLLYNIEN